MNFNGIIATKIAIGFLVTISVGSIGAGIYIKSVKDDLYEQGTNYDYSIKDSDIIKLPDDRYKEVNLRGEEIKYLALNEEYVIGDVSSYDYQEPMSDYMSEIMSFMKEPSGIEGLASRDISILKGSGYVDNKEEDYEKHTLQNPTLDTWLNEVENNQKLQNKIKGSNYITIEFGTMDLINYTIAQNRGREFMYGSNEGSIGDFISMLTTENPYGLFTEDIDVIKKDIISKYIELVSEIKSLTPNAIINTMGIKHINTSLYSGGNFDKDNSRFSSDSYLHEVVTSINGELSNELEVLDEKFNLGASLYIDPNPYIADKETNAIDGLTLAQHRADYTMIQAAKLFLRTNVSQILPPFEDTGILVSDYWGSDEPEVVYQEYLRMIVWPNDYGAETTSNIPKLSDVIYVDVDFENKESKHLISEKKYMTDTAKEIYENYTSFQNQGDTPQVYLGEDEEGDNIIFDLSKEIAILTQIVYYFDKIDVDTRINLINAVLQKDNYIEKQEAVQLIFKESSITFPGSIDRHFIIPNIPGKNNNDWKEFVESNDAVNSNEVLRKYLGF